MFETLCDRKWPCTKNPWEVRGRRVESLLPERTRISGGGWERTVLLRRTNIRCLFSFLPHAGAYSCLLPDGCRSSISLHSDNLRNSSCPHFRPPSPEAGWRRERGPGGPGGGEAVDAARAEPISAAFSQERPSGVGGTARSEPLGPSRDASLPEHPLPVRPHPEGCGAEATLGGSRGTRSPRPGGAHRAQFRRRPGGGAGAADQVTERRSRLREAAWFSAAVAAAVTATPSGGAGKGGPAGWGGGNRGGERRGWRRKGGGRAGGSERRGCCVTARVGARHGRAALRRRSRADGRA